MFKAKAWLHSQGHCATAGRGRPPKVSMKDGREITSVLLEATKSGVQFSDWPKGKIEVTESVATESKPAESTVKVIRTATQSGEKTVADLPTYRYDFETHKAVDAQGKTRTLAEVCKNSQGVSLVICYVCEDDAHRIVKTDGTGDITVTIKRKG